jgi:succinyl-diaminopimelate desuccinylase
MNKKIKKALSKHDFTEIADRITAKWQLKTQRNLSKASELESSEEILRDLVAMPTVTGDYEANHRAFDYVDQFFRERGMYVKRYEWNGIESIVASTRRTKTPKVCFFGHIDVVPGPEELFQLQERDDRYYGRGVLDMKGGVAAFLGTVQKMQDELDQYDFAVILTSDEEVGGFDGAARLAEEEGYRPGILIVPDGGENWNLERFAKGIWHVTLETNGKSAHGSRPWKGENAIDKLTIVLSKVRALFPDEMTPQTSTMNVGLIQGGEAINQIPSSASASIDMRFASSKDQERIMTAVKKLAEKEGFSVTDEVEANAVDNDPEHPLLKTYAECTEEIIGRPVEWITSMAGNDSRFFAKYGIPSAIAYPAGANHHSSDEYIEKEAFFQMQDLFIKYLRKVGKLESGSTQKAPAKKRVATT